MSELDVIRAYYQSVLTLDPSSPSNLNPTSDPSSAHKSRTSRITDSSDVTPTIKRRNGRKSDTLHKELIHPPWNPVEGISKVHLIPLQSPSNHSTCATSSSIYQDGTVAGGKSKMKWRDSSTLPPDSPDVGIWEEDVEMEVDELRSSSPVDPFGMISPPKVDGHIAKPNGSPVKRKKKSKKGEPDSADTNGAELDGQSVTPRGKFKQQSSKTPKKSAVSEEPSASAMKEKKQRKKKDMPQQGSEVPGSSTDTTAAAAGVDGEDGMGDTDAEQNAIEDLTTLTPLSPIKEKKATKIKRRKSNHTQEEAPSTPNDFALPATPTTPSAPGEAVEDEEGTEGKKKSKSKRKSMLSQEMTETPATPVNGGTQGKKEKKSARKSKAAPSWVVNTPR